MSDFDERLREALASGEKLDAGRSAELQDLIRTDVRTRHDKVIMRWLVSECILLPLFGLHMGLLFSGAGIKPSMQYGIVAVVLALAALVTRLWYWQMNNKLEVLQEVKLLRVQILSPGEAVRAGSYLSGKSIGEEMRERKQWLPLARGAVSAATVACFFLGWYVL